MPPPRRPRVLLLGGVAEARDIAQALAAAGVDAVYSYAGRTKARAPQPLPTRVGGFGGAEALRERLRAEAFTHVIDATHAFAARISANAQAACAAEGVAYALFERPAWTPGPGDDWREAATVDDAARALPATPQRVMLAIGRQGVGAFRARPEHVYLIRCIEAPEAADLPPDCRLLLSRGPFDEEEDRALMARERIDLLVCKNAGGAGAAGKLAAARTLGLPVIMIARPDRPFAGRRLRSAEDALAFALEPSHAG